MAIDWSTEIYTNDIPTTCPRDASTQYQIGDFNGSTYKRCIECGMVTKVTEEDNLVENVS